MGMGRPIRPPGWAFLLFALIQWLCLPLAFSHLLCFEPI
jgi:hypothetical protein